MTRSGRPGVAPCSAPRRGQGVGPPPVTEGHHLRLSVPQQFNLGLGFPFIVSAWSGDFPVFSC